MTNRTTRTRITSRDYRGRYCKNCEASLTEVDHGVGRCTQCGQPIEIEREGMMTTKTRTGYPVIDEILESIAPSHEQPASAPVSEWSYNYDGDRYHIRGADPNGDCVAHTDKLKDAERIANDHNQHQHCAAQFHFLGNRAEELSSLLAGMTTERDGLREQNERLREALRQVRSSFQIALDEPADHLARRAAQRWLAVIDAALNDERH